MSGGVYRDDQRAGTWKFRISVAGRDGRRRHVQRRGFPTKRAAQDALDEVRAEHRGDRLPDPHRLTFGQLLADRWLPALEGDTRLKPSTRQSYRWAARHLIRHAGHVPLADLRGDDLDRVQAALVDKSTSLRRRVHVTAHKALGDAVRWRLVGRNVAVDAAAPATPAPNPEAWTPHEVGRFLDAAEGDRWAALWLTIATTGMRRGEAVGMCWSDVDLDGQTLRITRSVTVADHATHVVTPKSGRGRTVRLDADTVAALRAWRAVQAAELLRLGPYRPEGDWCWTWPDGDRVHPDVITRTYRRLRDEAGLPPLRLHSLRHAWATAALDAGVDVKDVSTRLGHSSTRITMDVYVQPSSERDAAAATLVAGLYRRRTTRTSAL
jgi:integrase